MTYIYLFIASLLSVSCVTNDQDPEVKKPEIYANMPLDAAMNAAIQFGGSTLHDVKQLIKRRNEWPEAGLLSREAIVSGLLKYQDNELINAAHLYFASPMPDAPGLFQLLADSGRPLAGRIAWRLAAKAPSASMAKAMDDTLTRAVKASEEDSILWPEMAEAAVSNNLTDSYTLVREGLRRKGEDEFARAMIALDPKAASVDFFEYLTRATADELRQLTLTNVNLFTCVTILKHLALEPAATATPGFDHIFLFAVSRNRALAELAMVVIERHIPSDTQALAQKLAQQPVWVQMAYLENARRNFDPKVGLLVSELKEMTVHPDVIDEINEIKR